MTPSRSEADLLALDAAAVQAGLPKFTPMSSRR
jgi:hypothetical protein